MESELIKIDKLEDVNQWTTWRFHVRITLQSNDVFEVVRSWSGLCIPSQK